MGTGPLGKGVADRRRNLVLRGGRTTETEAGSVAGLCGACSCVLGLHVGSARGEVGPW